MEWDDQRPVTTNVWLMQFSIANKVWLPKNPHVSKKGAGLTRGVVTLVTTRAAMRRREAAASFSTSAIPRLQCVPFAAREEGLLTASLPGASGWAGAAARDQL